MTGLVWLLAGEASGDALGARLMAALARRAPDTSFAGVGGPLMQAEGLTSLFPMEELSLMGLVEVAPALLRLRRLLRHAAADIAERRPDAVVTIDSPGFTLRLLRAIRPLGLPRAHYVAPQVWAWREGRVRHFPGLWERLLCLLPFEPPFFARHGLAATFVGHPVLESGLGGGDGGRFRAAHGIPPEATVLLVLPGSRPGEVARHAGIFGATIARLLPAHPGLRPVVPAAPAVRAMLGGALAGWPVPPILLQTEAAKPDAFAAASAALCKSGTSALELALAGVPMVVAYRFNPITGFLARRLAKVPYASLVNLLAGREVVPEILQEQCTPERLTAALGALLTDPGEAASQRAAFGPVLASLAPESGTPSEAAADAVLEMIGASLPRHSR
ncbi:MAG TPA: lipid-A-disaccharide synthase [Acetobacteraceae bacterium]|nr:lipid-A-disaccharide synthase [Acetobacteraceae bacterium]